MVDFYPRPPRGGRPLEDDEAAIEAAKFLSTPSARRATASGEAKRAKKSIFLSTPSARRATGCHRLLSEGWRDFYPRPPRGGRRAKVKRYRPKSPFLSTPSARRATLTASRWTSTHPNFYPRPPRGGRRPDPEGPGISGHISIHALREEGDPPLPRGRVIFLHFYPRPPRGGRPDLGCTITSENSFLSTPSARRATRNAGFPYLAGMHFYPRPPRGGRRLRVPR